LGLNRFFHSQIDTVWLDFSSPFPFLCGTVLYG
jgi:hypothetical protein